MMKIIDASRSLVERRWSSLSKRARGWLGSITVVVLLVVLAVIFGSRPAVDWVVGKIYQNVVPPDDSEMAVTVTAYPSSSHIVSIIGGKGEGLNCSLPPLADFFFDRVKGSTRDAPVRQRFRQACVFHDLCYRHGMATYGYTQNDCDQMLQEHAMRICLNAFSKDPEQCQLDAKKVLAGVSHGGFDAYQPWRTSTYFEFDSSPQSSDQMTAARVIDHPFKAADKVASRNDPDQLLLTFDITRAGTTVACRNCSDRTFSQGELEAAGLLPPSPPAATGQGQSPSGVLSVDHREAATPVSAAAARVLEDLVRPKLNQTRPVGLPASGIHAAPYLVTGSGGEQSVVWLNRETVQNTVTCAVIADPKHLLTHTRPNDSVCRTRANSRMRVVQADIYASSPQPMLVTNAAQAAVLAMSGTGLSLAKSLRTCLSSDLKTTNPVARPPHCYGLQTPAEVAVPPELGAFQNFPIIKSERQIYLSRSVFSDPNEGSVSDAGRALVFDLDHRYLASTNRPPAVKLQHDRSFVIPDEYDPMMALTKDKDDLRLVSVRSSKGKMAIYEIDLKADKPEPVRIATAFGRDAQDLDLDASWARRPVLVVEPPLASGEQPKTQVILSRSAVTTTPETGDKEDTVRFEFLVLERNRSDTGKRPLKHVRGLDCKITYQLRGGNSSRPCQRSSEQVGERRPSPAQMLQGAQLLVGRLAAPTTPATPELDLALPDACYASRPLVMKPLPAEESMTLASYGFELAATVTRAQAEQRIIQRQVECKTLTNVKQIAEAMPDAR